MKKLSEKSFTRITLALDIIGKIESGPFTGFHELNAIKHTISLFDVITVEDPGKCDASAPSRPCRRMLQMPAGKHAIF